MNEDVFALVKERFNKALADLRAQYKNNIVNYTFFDNNYYSDGSYLSNDPEYLAFKEAWDIAQNETKKVFKEQMEAKGYTQIAEYECPVTDGLVRYRRNTDKKTENMRKSLLANVLKKDEEYQAKRNELTKIRDETLETLALSSLPALQRELFNDFNKAIKKIIEAVSEKTK